MSQTVIDDLGTHRVYSSTRRIMRKIAKNLEIGYAEENDYTKVLHFTKTTFIRYASINFKRDNLYLLPSPIMSLADWEALVKNIPMVLVEEYFRRGNYKDTIVRSIFARFRKYPFICITKKTAAMLDDLHIRYFLIPPTEEKKISGKKRKHILFLARTIPSKNPFFFLKLAEQFKEEKFIIIGKGELSNQIATKAEESKNVEYIEHVETEEEINGYYRDAKLLIHPAFQDPVGQIIPEALSTSTPVLAYEKTGASSFLPKEWVMDSFDEGTWIRKIREIISNQDESIKKAELTFEKEHLNTKDPYFDRMAEELEEYIKERWSQFDKR